jgi:hypothetical protein
VSSATSVLQQVRSLGVDIRPVGDKLQLRPLGKLSAELLEAVKKHKHEIIAILCTSDAMSRGALTRALEQKQQESAVMRERLSSPCYADDSEHQIWCRHQIDTLRAHMSEIQRYLKAGGTLRLPLCCKDESHTCLIAMRRFNGCLMAPGECGFSIRGLK